MAKVLTLSSPVWDNNNEIPVKYTCEGENINPPLQIYGTPEETQSLALTMEDPDAPAGTFVHWVVWNLSPLTTEIKEGEQPNGGIGKGSSGNRGYLGPCPPSGTHRYVFKIYALDLVLDIPEGADITDLTGAMIGHIIDEAEYVGLYQKKKD